MPLSVSVVNFWRNKLFKFLLVFLFSSSLLLSADKEIFKLTDPRGDDYGDSTLIYPLRDYMHQGDFDLVSFSARQDEGGTLFEVAFTNKIQVPGPRAIDAGGMTLSRIMRYGFYTFNVDVYIDKDGVKDSGNIRTLPGRVANVVPENAWERVVCLTPRPNEAKSLMENILEKREYDLWKARKGRVDPEDDVEIKGKAKKDLNDQYFFPTQVRVAGPTIRFFVPASFLGGAADPSWHYVVVVTGATIEEKIDLSGLVGKDVDVEPPLLNLVIASGPPTDGFGTSRKERDALQTPIVDIIVPEGEKQSEILRNYDMTTGRPVMLPGVTPK
jgi:C-terminal binding-module, SLH-like, of glucodextranase